MSDQVYWNLELGIKPGKMNDLKELVSEMSKRTRDHEPGTLNYEWTVNAENGQCHTYERYVDSDALMQHLGNFQEHFAARFFDILDIVRWNVYGKASDQVREALGGLGAVFYDPLGGFKR